MNFFLSPLHDSARSFHRSACPACETGEDRSFLTKKLTGSTQPSDRFTPILNEESGLVRCEPTPTSCLPAHRDHYADVCSKCPQ